MNVEKYFKKTFILLLHLTLTTFLYTRKYNFFLSLPEGEGVCKKKIIQHKHGKTDNLFFSLQPLNQTLYTKNINLFFLYLKGKVSWWWLGRISHCKLPFLWLVRHNLFCHSLVQGCYSSSPCIAYHLHSFWCNLTRVRIRSTHHLLELEVNLKLYDNEYGIRLMGID